MLLEEGLWGKPPPESKLIFSYLGGSSPVTHCLGYNDPGQEPGLPRAPSLNSKGKMRRGRPLPPGDGDSAQPGDPGQGDSPLWLLSSQVFSQWVSTAQHGKGSRSPEQEMGGAGGRAAAECMSVLTQLYCPGLKNL